LTYTSAANTGQLTSIYPLHLAILEHSDLLGRAD
jgi:hypothetical protein